MVKVYSSISIERTNSLIGDQGKMHANTFRLLLYNNDSSVIYKSNLQIDIAYDCIHYGSTMAALDPPETKE